MSTVILFSLGEKQASIDWRNYNCLAKIRTSGICRLVNFDNNVPVFTNLLILETMKDRKYWNRLNTTIQHFNLPIDIWNVGKAAY
jgi:hypothetical protein